MTAVARRAPPLALLAALAVAPAAARAQVATTNLQLLQGWAFEDPAASSDVKGGERSTVTLNHFSTWSHGDTFAFADLMQGQFRDGANSHVYAEVHARLFLNRLLGAKGKVLGVLRDAGFAGELNLGYGFQAWLGGIGGDVALGSGAVSLAVYYRYAALQIPSAFIRQYDHTWQVSPSWVIPFEAGAPFLFTGFVDVNGVKTLDGGRGTEVMAQPELLVDVLALAGGPRSVVLAGVEWYLHYHPDNEALGAPSNLVSAPQVVAQWILH